MTTPNEEVTFYLASQRSSSHDRGRLRRLLFRVRLFFDDAQLAAFFFRVVKRYNMLRLWSRSRTHFSHVESHRSDRACLWCCIKFNWIQPWNHFWDPIDVSRFRRGKIEFDVQSSFDAKIFFSSASDYPKLGAREKRKSINCNESAIFFLFIRDIWHSIWSCGMWLAVGCRNVIATALNVCEKCQEINLKARAVLWKMRQCGKFMTICSTSPALHFELRFRAGKGWKVLVLLQILSFVDAFLCDSRKPFNKRISIHWRSFPLPSLALLRREEELNHF